MRTQFPDNYEKAPNSTAVSIIAICIKWPVCLFQIGQYKIQYIGIAGIMTLAKCKSTAYYSVFSVDEFYTNIIELHDCLFDYNDTKHFVAVSKSHI